jgi:outer membrane protein OmpA-like peptidoglycan-associated protein
MAYQRVQASDGLAAQYKPDQVHEAKVALDKAEQSFVDSPTDPKTKDLAYVAVRKAEIAEANGANDQAIAMKEQAEKDAKLATKGQLAATGKMLTATGQRLASAQEQLEAEKVARADAEKRAKDSIERLSTLGGVKQESRGVVITLPGSILFASGKSTFLPTGQEKLAQVAEALKDQGSRRFVVEGHTDSQGAPNSNQVLSERRAQAVMSFLLARGFPAEQIRAQGFGMTHPIADNKTAEGRATNRRIEIVVQPEGK